MSLAKWKHGSTVEFTTADYYWEGYKDYYCINCVGSVVLSHPLSREGGAAEATPPPALCHPTRAAPFARHRHRLTKTIYSQSYHASY